MTLDENRAKHSLAVARLMERLAPLLGLDGREAALCGWVHDLGWLWVGNRGHAKAGGAVLRDAGYRDWRVVAAHGSPDGCASPLGFLLNLCDMLVGSDGRLVGFDGRLADVDARYGADSVQSADCRRVIGALRGSMWWSRVATVVDALGCDTPGGSMVG